MHCRCFLFFLLIILMTGCGVNPVTGDRELGLVSESYELNIGKNQYGPGRQMQGGDYTLDPELSAYVQEVGQRLASVSDRRLPYEFVVLNNSTPNAWTLPGGKIAVNRGLLVELDNEAELAAVLAHEIVHAAARHGAKNVERGFFLQGAMMATGIALRNNDYGRYAVGGAEVAASLISGKYSRDAELEADYYGMIYMARAGYDPAAAVKLQETFVRLQKGGGANWLDGLFASHPPSEERVAANRKTVQEISAGGRLGTEWYRQKIARLVTTKKAYELLDQGRDDIAEDKVANAMNAAQQALAIEPREGHFHALYGDACFAKGMYGQALSSFNLALESNSGYFYYYLRRGLTKMKLSDFKSGFDDLQTSVGLLPTATAYNAMGQQMLIEGDRNQAKQYFSAAASSDSESGRQARFAFVQLDLPDNPGRYLRTEAALQGDYALVRVFNPTPVPVRSASYILEYRDQKGMLRGSNRSFLNAIPAGGTVSTRLWLGPDHGADAGKGAVVRLMDAQISQ